MGPDQWSEHSHTGKMEVNTAPKQCSAVCLVFVHPNIDDYFSKLES